MRQLARGDARRVDAAGDAPRDDVTVGDDATQVVVLRAANLTLRAPEPGDHTGHRVAVYLHADPS